ncbi:MAG: hypothetical protein IJ257_02300 [Treponema sp.]|nr:hypothetical protein [Treponema sp.]
MFLNENAFFLRRFFLKSFFLLLIFPLFSERYKISETNYTLEKTREEDLRRSVFIDTNRIFENEEEFAAYIADLKQRLMNTRAFDTVELTIKSESSETNEENSADTQEINESSPENNKIKQVSLAIECHDTKSLLILPYPKYDSNNGFIFKIKVKDVNFFGTMNTMNAGAFIGLKEDVKTGEQNLTFGTEFNYSYPFQAGPFKCSWNNSLELEYTSGVKLLEFWSGSGFTFELPFNRFSLVYNISEHANRDSEYDEFDDTLHFTTDSTFSIPVKLFDIDNWGAIFWTPFVSGKVSYDNDGINIKNDDLASPVLSVGQSISTNRINWYGNFRQGLYAQIGHSLGYDFMQEEIEPRVFAEIQAFKAFKYAGINTRISVFASNSNRNLISDKIRGVRDKQTYANSRHKALKTPSALVLNLDLPIHLITTHWLDWSNSLFGEDSWFSRTFAWTDKFNFELQVSPFFDIALTKNEVTGRLFAFEDGWYTGGIEFLLFPERWKGIVMRASLGIDLGRAFISEKYPDKIDMSWRESIKKYEIFAGIGLHY